MESALMMKVLRCQFLKELVGESLMMDELKPKQIVRGTCQSVGKIGFGLFVDAGIENPTKEILIPL